MAAMNRIEPTRILILGGGFGGVAVAMELEKRLRRDDAVQVTLINRENFVLFTPMLHEVAASDVDITHIVNPIRKLLRRVQLFTGTIEWVDLERRMVGVTHGDGRHAHELGYDQLVIALGAVSNFYGIRGLAERALTMKSLGDAVALRNRLIQRLEEADLECNADVRRQLLTFVVAGGGFAGVETAAAAYDFLREAVRFYRNLLPRDVQLVLVEAGPRILTELNERLSTYARSKLQARGVDVRVDTSVTAVTADTVELSDGTTIAARTIVWTAGVSPNPLVRALPCEQERGRVRADECLRVKDWPGVWVLGDCASVIDPATGHAYPPTAQHATRQGKRLARNLLATLRGEATQPFAFSTLGALAAIGRRAGVAEILGLRFSGFIAWWLWRTIYLAKLPRLEKKLRVALDWTLDLLFSKDLVELGDGGKAGSRSEPASRKSGAQAAMASNPVPAKEPMTVG